MVKLRYCKVEELIQETRLLKQYQYTVSIFEF